MDHRNQTPDLDIPASPDPTPPTEGSIHPSVVESAPFDYDTYYGADSPWPSSEPEQETPEVPKERRTRDGVLFFIGALAAGVLGAALTVGILAATGTFETTDSASQVTTTEAISTTSAAVEDGTSDRPTINNTIINNELGAAVNPTAVAIKTVPSIVTVSTFNGAPGEGIGVGSGSGVVLTADGYIATNEHVVDGASGYTVTFEDGRIYEAELVGTDELTDLAVLRIDADDLVPIELGTSEDLRLGDPAVAVGNPLGQQGGASITVGIVSAFDRQVDFADDTTLFGMIQTDAAINSGSSGGALVNDQGQLIGITSAIGVSNAGPEGIGYAIPVELVSRITDEIIETGDVEHPFLGVTVGTFNSEQPDGAIRPDGAELIEITGTDSAAAQAGLQEGDVVVRIGDEPITSQNDLILAVRLYRVGDEVEFVVLRDGEPQTVTVVMGQRPAEFQG